MKAIVCGGRRFADWVLLDKSLAAIHAETPFDRIATGAMSGADTLADSWARSHGISVERYYALWRTYGKAAGPLRNSKMLHDEQPDVVIAFPGGSGTADMVRQAKMANIRVIRVETPS